MSQTEKKWSDFEERPSKVFGYEVPVFTPSIFREFRGEIFTTFHSEEHPVMRHINYDKNEIVRNMALELCKLSLNDPIFLNFR